MSVTLMRPKKHARSLDVHLASVTIINRPKSENSMLDNWYEVNQIFRRVNPSGLLCEYWVTQV